MCGMEIGHANSRVIPLSYRCGVLELPLPPRQNSVFDSPGETHVGLRILILHVEHGLQPS